MTSPFELAKFECPLLDHFKQQQAYLLTLQSQLFHHLISHNDFSCCETADCIQLMTQNESDQEVLDQLKVIDRYLMYRVNLWKRERSYVDSNINSYN